MRVRYLGLSTVPFFLDGISTRIGSLKAGIHVWPWVVNCLAVLVPEVLNELEFPTEPIGEATQSDIAHVDGDQVLVTAEQEVVDEPSGTGPGVEKACVGGKCRLRDQTKRGAGNALIPTGLIGRRALIHRVPVLSAGLHRSGVVSVDLFVFRIPCRNRSQKASELCLPTGRGWARSANLLLTFAAMGGGDRRAP